MNAHVDTAGTERPADSNRASMLINFGLVAPLEEPQDLRDLFHQRHKAARARLLSVVVPPLAPKALPDPPRSVPRTEDIPPRLFTALRQRRLSLTRNLPKEIRHRPMLMRAAIRILWEANLTWAAIVGPSRLNHTVRARQELLVIVHANVRLSYLALARIFGRDHATVRYALGMKGVIPLMPSRLKEGMSHASD